MKFRSICCCGCGCWCSMAAASCIVVVVVVCGMLLLLLLAVDDIMASSCKVTKLRSSIVRHTITTANRPTVTRNLGKGSDTVERRWRHRTSIVVVVTSSSHSSCCGRCCRLAIILRTFRSRVHRKWIAACCCSKSCSRHYYCLRWSVIPKRTVIVDASNCVMACRQ